MQVFSALADYGCEVGNGFSTPSECDDAVTGCCGRDGCHGQACSGAAAVPQRQMAVRRAIGYGPISAEPAATHAAASVAAACAAGSAVAATSDFWPFDNYHNSGYS